MTIKRMLTRFFVMYFGAMIIVGLIMSYLEIKSISGLNAGVLCLCVVWVCESFGKKNERYFSNKEKWLAILGFFLIDIFTQVLLGMPVILRMAQAKGMVAFLISIIIVMMIHLFGICVFVNASKRMLIKRGVIES